MTAIDFSDVQFTYGSSRKVGLDVPHLALDAGEVTAIMGRSGSGKTTLLRCIAGLVVPQRGTVRVLGQDVTRLNDRGRARLRREVCDMIFQDFALVEALTAEENVALAVRMAGRRPDPQQVASALDQVGLQGLGRRKVWEMSGGQQQRVAVARALIKNGGVVLADEPTASLDSASAETVVRAMQDFAHRDGKPVIVVSHDAWVASESDRVLILEDGHIVDDLRGASFDDLVRVGRPDWRPVA